MKMSELLHIETNAAIGKGTVHLSAGAEITEDYCSQYEREPRWFIALKATMGIDRENIKTNECL